METMNESLRAGADNYPMKPLVVDQCLAMLLHMLCTGIPAAEKTAEPGGGCSARRRKRPRRETGDHLQSGATYLTCWEDFCSYLLEQTALASVRKSGRPFRRR